jgi:transcription initiation factor IIE alpha subunit
MIRTTSRDAFEDIVKPTLGARQEAVMAALRTRIDFTNHELSEFLHQPINTITPRIFELRKKGLVIESCRRPDKDTGVRAIAWRVKGEQQKLI